ncbi:MAG: hypothetical protein V4662_26965 [Verrucomicrobiota bacterium]
MPQVFISYRQLDDAQRQRVRDFAHRVRTCGIDVVLDQFYKDSNPGGPPEGWPKWSSDQATKTERVLIIGNTPWFKCYDGTENPDAGLGAACEARDIRQRLYDRGGHNDIVRIVHFDKSDLDHISHGLKSYDWFHAEKNFDTLIAWLGGTIPTVLAAPLQPLVTPAPLIWPARLTSFVPDMANRHDEFTFFADTLTGTVQQRATFISAGTDHGKTKLVAEFYRYGCEVLGDHACSWMDFKSRGTVSDLWDTLALDLGTRLPGLNDRSPVKLREVLRNAREPVLIVLDTYESATEEAREFVHSNLLGELRRTDAVRLLVAGQPQTMPDPAKEAWRAYARRFELGNIPDAAPWIAWAKETYPQIPREAVITIVALTGGVPGATANQLNLLHGKYSAAQLAEMFRNPS